jgi:Pyruvate/2-oxoacid:ferredoxin oxidoreductase delta subunit
VRFSQAKIISTIILAGVVAKANKGVQAMLYGFCGGCDVCRSANSVVTTSAATKSLQSCRETIRRVLG